MALDQIVLPGTSGAVVLFGGGATYAAGTYRIYYVTGAYQFTNAGGVSGGGWLGPWEGANSQRIYVNGGQVALFPAAPGAGHSGAPPSGAYASQAAAQAASGGLTYTLVHPGGTIGMATNDSDFSENLNGSPNCTFSLEFQQVPGVFYVEDLHGGTFTQNCLSPSTFTRNCL